MKHPTPKRPLAAKMAALFAALAAFATTSQAQSVQQLTNGLVDYYPLNTVFASVTTNQGIVSTNYTTPDFVSRRDMTLYRMNAANIVSDTHPGIESADQVFNMNQSGGNATFIYYQTTGQNPLGLSGGAGGSGGDFLPFINERGATMNYWFKGTNTTGNEYRVMAETDNGGGDNNSFFSISDTGTVPARFFFRGDSGGSDLNGNPCYDLEDGTYELPNPYYAWQQPNEYSTSNYFDNNWHMLTVTIDTNGDVHLFIDGSPDPGTAGTSPAGPANTDNEGNQSISPPIYVTNFYYTTNNYPLVNPATNNPPPNGYVSWVLPHLAKTGVTVFGGYLRNGSYAAGMPGNMSDIGFWDRVLATNEIQFLATNGLNTNGVFALPLNTNAIVASLTADFGEVGRNHGVTLHWSVTGASSSPGGVVITGIGDVSANPVGSTTVTLGNNASYTFTMTAHNGIVANVVKSVSVITLAGVASDWNLIQRFDGLFANTTAGLNGNGWIGLSGDYAGTLDRFNVVTVNGNKVILPKSGYAPDSGSPVGWDTPGAVTYGFLNGLTIPPYQENTLFFRFSVTEPTPVPYVLGSYTSIYSGLDFALGVTDFGFATGPQAGTQPPGGGGTYGPGLHILQSDSTGDYQPQAWDLTANDYSGPTSTVTNTYDYLTAANGNPNGLQTNVTYYCWLDISNNNTSQIISGGTTNTQNEPLYSLWIEPQGASSRTLLFSNFSGDRSYSTAGQNSDNPTPYLNKVYVSVASENILNSDNGAFFATNNMILVDDFYLSTNGFDGTIPRLLNLNSIVRNPANAVIQWESLGSMFQTNTYSVQRTLSLNPASWVILTNGLPSGGDFTSFTDTTVGNAQTAFYRVTWP